MLRKPWKARESEADQTLDQDSDEDGDSPDEGETTATEMEQIPEEIETAVAGTSEEMEDDTDDEEQVVFGKIQIPARVTTTPSSSTPLTADSRDKARKGRAKGRNKGQEKPRVASNVDDLAQSMDALSLVPTSIQFGRGAKRGGLQGARGRGSQGHARRGSGGSVSGRPDAPMDVDMSHGHVRGRGGRPARVPRGGALRAMAVRDRGRRGARG